MTNSEIGRLLRNVAAAYAVKDEKKFRFQIIAYEKSADAIEHSATEVKELIKEGKINQLSGIGPSITAYLKELINTNRVKHFSEILKGVPEAMFPLLDIPSFGPKKAYRLVTEFALTNPASVITDVEKIAKEGKIAQLEGFGVKSQQDILQAITDFERGKTKTSRMVLPYANELAKKIISYLKQSKAVLQAYPLGSLRRKVSTIGDIDIAVATHDPKTVLAYFVKYPHSERVIEKGEHTSSIVVTGGKQIDLMTQPPESFGALLQHFTGSKAHNIKLREYALSLGFSLSEYGIRPKSNKSNAVALHIDTEEKFYNKLKLQWIPPEIREDTGEIELAKNNNLPQLVELKDIKGDFHIHSNFPVEESHDPGQNSMEEMLQEAIKLGYEYLAFSEHNPSQSKHAAEEITNIMKKRSNFIDQMNSKYKKNIRVISLLETDILPSGKLAINDTALSLLDATIVSVHSVFTMNKKEMTKRVLQGLSHPKAKILAHPTGRLLNERLGYELEWEEVFDFCSKHNKALEINAWPLRLDLPDNLVRQAIKQGVILTIDTDSHAVDQMNMMEYGVYVARRGWATSRDILNTWSYNEVIEWFHK